MQGLYAKSIILLCQKPTTHPLVHPLWLNTTVVHQHHTTLVEHHWFTNTTPLCFTNTTPPLVHHHWFTNTTPLLSQILQEHNRADDFIGDFCDGKLFKTHPLFKDAPKSLQIIAYFDEVEVCNPLAGHAGVHKLGK